MKKLPSIKTIRGKIVFITAGITLLITVITVCTCFSVFQFFLKKNQIQSTEFNLQLVANNVSSDLEKIVYLNKWCGSNNEVLNYLETFGGMEKLAEASKNDKTLKPLALTTYKRLMEEYYNTKPSDYITRIIISTDNSQNILQVMSTTSASAPYASETLTSSEYFQILYDSPDDMWIGFIDDPFFKKTGRELILPFISPIYNQFSSDIIGWTYLSVSSKLITDYLKSYPLADDSDLYLSIGTKLYQIEGNTILESEPDFTVLSDIRDASLDSATRAQLVKMADGHQRTLVSRAVGPDGWYLCQTLSEQQLSEQKQIYLLLIVGICVLILSLGFVLVFLLNRTINQPVAMIRRKMDAISAGDFSWDTSIEWDHEIGEIGKGINHLSKNVVTLMDKRIDDEKQKKDLEYQILQSQINPHFLYNALNSIKWMATIQGSSGIAEMTTALARLMKSISKGTSTLVTLGEELDLVKDYFLIQQYRYGGSVTIDYHIESEDLYHCKIHRFSLQPIIENALFHGIEPKGAAGNIRVNARAFPVGTRKHLEITVTDNGIGMTPETIHRILHSKANPGNDFFKQIGINNVNQRIQYDYGPAYGITIHSIPGEYTTMIIVIPYMNDDEIEEGEEER